MSQAKYRTYSLLSNQRQSSGACKRPSRWVTRAGGLTSFWKRSSSSPQSLAAAQKQRRRREVPSERNGGETVRSWSPLQRLECELLISHVGRCLPAEAPSPAMNHRRNRGSCWRNRRHLQFWDRWHPAKTAISREHFNTAIRPQRNITVKQTALPSQTKASASD